MQINSKCQTHWSVYEFIFVFGIVTEFKEFVSIFLIYKYPNSLPATSALYTFEGIFLLMLEFHA